MKLVVCSTYDQARNLKEEYPDDKVVVVGQMLMGLRVTEIVDRRFIHQYGVRADYETEWMEFAKTRVGPE